MASTAREAQQLAELGAKLKRLGRGDLRRELLGTIRAAAKPLGEAARRSALETLPRSGGLADEVAASPVRVRTSLSARSARVRLTDQNPHRTRTMDRGRVRHPVYGHEPYVTQQIKPGWWTKPMEEGSPRVRAEIIHAIDEIGRKLTV